MPPTSIPAFPTSAPQRAETVSRGVIAFVSKRPSEPTTACDASIVGSPPLPDDRSEANSIVSSPALASHYLVAEAVAGLTLPS